MQIHVEAESWPLTRPFRISRGVKTQAEVVVVRLSTGNREGRGECVPYSRYGESIAQVVTEIREAWTKLEPEPTRAKLQQLLTAGAARNALDCALWDLEAKQKGLTVWELLAMTKPQALSSMRTLVLDGDENFEEISQQLANTTLLKIKVDGTNDLERIERLHTLLPKAKIIVDANEAWTEGQLKAWLPILKRLNVVLIEQPLPQDNDHALLELERSIEICADESVHDRASIPGLLGKYDVVNIKLDKSGGLSEALHTIQAARDAGLKLMVGSMVSTSLSIAPALIAAQYADYVDLDGHLFLERDREPAIKMLNEKLQPPELALWG